MSDVEVTHADVYRRTVVLFLNLLAGLFYPPRFCSLGRWRMNVTYANRVNCGLVWMVDRRGKPSVPRFWRGACSLQGILPRVCVRRNRSIRTPAKYGARKLLDGQGARALAVSLLADGWVLRNRNSTWTRVEGNRKESKDNIAIRAKNSRASILLLSGVGGVGGV